MRVSTAVSSLGEAHGVATRFTCETRLVSGRVTYNGELEDEPEQGMALICCARPPEDLVLDV